MRHWLIAAACAGAVSAAAEPAQPIGAKAKSFTVATKVGRSNIELRIILHPQVDSCSGPLLKEIRGRALALGQAHMRENLSKVIKASGTDASGDKQFFGLSFLAGCPAAGAPWIAFPAEGKDKVVTRFTAAAGWSPLAPL
jgi:hypothetical protein